MKGRASWRRFVETIPRWPGWLLVGVGLVKLALAGVSWLQTGTWKPQSGVAALEELGFSQANVNAWLAAPRSWIGLHKIAVVFLRWPAFVLYLLAGFILALAALPIVDALEARRQRAEAERRFW